MIGFANTVLHFKEFLLVNIRPGVFLPIDNTCLQSTVDLFKGQQFLTIFTEEVRKANAQATAINAQSKQAIIDAGGTVRTLSPQQRQLWVDTMKPVWQQFVDDIGQDVIDAAVAANN